MMTGRGCRKTSASALPRERPILFRPELVSAILAGAKTQTRRILKGGSPAGHARPDGCWQFPGTDTEGSTVWTLDELARNWPCPYGAPGDRLWVRERWAWGQRGGVMYAADDPPNSETVRWRPSIHLPRSASRLTLEILSVRPERLQAITEEDAFEEGVPRWANGDGVANGHFLDRPLDPLWCDRCQGEGLVAAVGASLGVTETECTDCDTPRKLFRNVWDRINKPRGHGWDVNPWVWRITFRRLAP